MSRKARVQWTGIVFALLAALLAGCAQYSDASDPDPHYFKGKQFVHKRTA